MHINISLRKVGPHKTRHVTVKCHLTGEIILLHVPDRTCAHRHATELTTIFWTNVLQHRRAWWCGQLLAVFNYKFSFCLSLPRGKGNDLWENNLQWSLQWSDKYGDVRLRDGARLRFIFSHSYRLARACSCFVQLWVECGCSKCCAPSSSGTLITSFASENILSRSPLLMDFCRWLFDVL